MNRPLSAADVAAAAAAVDALLGLELRLRDFLRHASAALDWRADVPQAREAVEEASGVAQDVLLRLDRLAAQLGMVEGVPTPPPTAPKGESA